MQARSQGTAEMREWRLARNRELYRTHRSEGRTFDWTAAYPNLEEIQHSSHVTGKRQHHACSQHQQVRIFFKNVNWRCTPPSKTTARTTTLHYSASLQGCIIASDCCQVTPSRSPLQLVQQSVTGESSTTPPTSNIYHKIHDHRLNVWWDERCQDRLTAASAKPFPTRYFVDAHCCILVNCHHTRTQLQFDRAFHSHTCYASTW